MAPPAAPGGFGTQVRTGPLSVRSVWTDASTNESGFSLQRSTDGGVTWTQLSTRPATAGTGTALNRTDTAVTLGSTYSYRVVAWNAGGRAATATETVTVAAPPAPVVTTPAQATSTSATTESIALTWTAVPGAQDYRIERATSAAGAGRVSVTRPGTSYTFTNLTKRVWYVRVGARNGLGTTYSPWVAVAAAP
ncbi:MAG: fibronectin type III domain-containing protein [Actinobacteria bacterium]|nr:fibronectin type III domain-containing protein [Actinomycetota bacterium]